MDEPGTVQPPAGWYPNPDDPGSERLWDGHRWSDQYRPSTTVVHQSMSLTPAPTRTPKESGVGCSTGAAVGAAIALFSLLLVGGCGVVLAGTAFLTTGRAEFEETRVEREFAVVQAPVPAPVPTTAASPEFDQGLEIETGTVGGQLSFGSSLLVVQDVGDPADPAIWEPVVDRPRDITDLVLEQSPAGTVPGDDIIYAGVWVVLTLESSPIESLTPGDAVSWQIIGGSTGAVYPAPMAGEGSGPCSGLADLFDASAPMSVGQSIEGFVCTPVSAVDLVHPDTNVVMSLSGGDKMVWGP